MSGKKQTSSHRSFLGWLKENAASGQQVIGIDIGAAYLKLLQLQKKTSGYVIANCVTKAFPPNLKENAAERRKLVGEFIREFIAESRLKQPLGRIVISGKGVFVFFLTIPQMNSKDMRSAVSIELKKRLPFQTDIANVAFDFFVCSKNPDDKSALCQVTCIAADRLTVEEQVTFLKEIGIQPVGISVIPDALGTALEVCLKPAPDKTIALLDIGATTSLLNFYKGRDLVFSREIPLGGEHFTHALAKPVASATGGFTMTADDAEKLKRNCGIPMDAEAHTEFLTDYGPMIGEQIVTMLRPHLERLVLEVSRTCTYYAKTFKSAPVDELYLTGGSSRLRNLDRFLQKNLEGFRKIEPLQVLKIVKGWADSSILKQELVMEQAAPHLAVAFGLCLGSGGRVNLLPEKEKVELKAALVSTVVAIALPLVVLVTAFFCASSYTAAQRYQAVILKLQKEVSTMDRPVQQVKEYLGMKARLEQSKELLAQARGKQPLWWGIFKEISAVTPDTVTLSRIDAGPSDQMKEIHLYGRIASSYAVLDLALSQYVASLEDSVFFKDVRLLVQEKDMYSAVPAADFEIVCKLEY